MPQVRSHTLRPLAILWLFVLLPAHGHWGFTHRAKLSPLAARIEQIFFGADPRRGEDPEALLKKISRSDSVVERIAKNHATNGGVQRG